MTAVASMPQTIDPFSSLATGARTETGTLDELLRNPLQFQEQLDGAGTPATDIPAHWIQVNPPPNVAASTSTLASSSATSGPSTPAAAQSNGKSGAKTLYEGSITLSYPRSQLRAVGRGFSNVGNTCYLNSVLQAVIVSPGLAHLLLSHQNGTNCLSQPGLKGKKCVFCSMRAVYEHSFFKPETSAYNPSVITSRIKEIGSTLRTHRQEDSHEFLRFLIDGLQNAELAPYGLPSKLPVELKHSTSVHQLYGGRLRSRVECQRCGKPSDTFDACLDVSVEVRKCDTLAQAFDKFIQIDKLDGANKYKCETCKMLTPAKKQLTIFEAPRTLVVHMKRFSPTGGKLTHAVSYPQRLDISPYMSQGSEGAAYKLYAIVCHSGSGPHCGHYTARCLGSDGRWYNMDDSDVSPIGTAPPLHLKSAYLLFYTREKGDVLKRALASKPKTAPPRSNPFAQPVVGPLPELEDYSSTAGPARLTGPIMPDSASGIGSSPSYASASALSPAKASPSSSSSASPAKAGQLDGVAVLANYKSPSSISRAEKKRQRRSLLDPYMVSRPAKGPGGGDSRGVMPYTNPNKAKGKMRDQMRGPQGRNRS